MNMKAQAAVEFMVFFGFFALVFLMVSVTLLDRQMVLVKKEQGELVKEVCLGLRDGINTAIFMGDGYWNTVELKRWAGGSYAVRLRNGSISVREGERNEGQYYLAALADNRIEGLASDSEGMILDMKKGSVMIRNQGGVIILEQ